MNVILKCPNQVYALFGILIVAGLSPGGCAPESSSAVVEPAQMSRSPHADLEAVLTPETASGAGPEQGPRRIHLGAGATSVTVNGTLPQLGRDRYVLPALAGQTHAVVDIAAPWPTTLSISGENGTIVALERMDERSHWEGRVPSTQDYVLDLGSIGPGSSFDYALTASFPSLTDPTPAMGIYRSTEYSLEVEYPSDFGRGTCPVADGIVDGDPEILFLRLLGDPYYAGTNLLDACVVITVDGSGAARSTCRKPRDSESPEEREEHLGQDEINGIEFSIVSRGGATTRHTHELTGYRTLHANACYEVILFLYYRNLRTYAPGAVSEFDRRAVMDKLEQALYSITMLPPEEDIREDSD